jgi:hypothetical protein
LFFRLFGRALQPAGERPNLCSPLKGALAFGDPIGEREHGFGGKREQTGHGARIAQYLTPEKVLFSGAIINTIVHDRALS